MVVPISWDWGKHPYSVAELASVRGKATSELSPRVPASQQALSIEASRVSLHQPGGLCHSTLLLLQRESSHGLLSVDVNKWAWLPSNLIYTWGNLSFIIFMCLTKLISMPSRSKILCPWAWSPYSWGKGRFQVKTRLHWPHISLSRFLLLCLFYMEGLIQALVPTE